MATALFLCKRVKEEGLFIEINEKNDYFCESKTNKTTEMAKIKGAITVNIERCKGCDLCVVACPTKTLALQANEVNDRGYHYAYMADPDKCTGCASCAMVCPDACIEVYRVRVD